MRKIRNKVGILMILALCIATLFGCSLYKKGNKGKEDAEIQNGELEESAEGKIEKAEKVENEELKLDSTVLAVGKDKVSFRELMAYMYLLKANYEPEFGSGIWDFQIEGQTFERKALEEVLHMVTEMKIIRREAKNVPLDLSADELDEIKVKAENYMARIPTEDIDKYGLTTEVLTTVFADNEIANKMFDICMNEVDTRISDDEAKQMTVQYLLLMTNGTNKNGVVIEMDEENRSDTLARAKRLHKKATKAESFYSFAEANTDLGQVEQTIGKSSMSQEFMDAAWGLKTGEYSDVVVAPEGFYIIYCVNDFDEKATKQEKERMILEGQTAIFEKRYEDWAGNYQVRISNLLWDYNYFT